MSDRVDELLQRYQARYRAGAEPDPRSYLDEVAGLERAELAALIDGFLASAPPRAFDAARFEAFRDSPAGRFAAERVEHATATQDLVGLRNEAKLTRGRLVAALAERLGLADRERAVAHRYHQLEQGLIEPTGVSEQVWEVLGELLHRSGDAVRAAAPGVGPAAAGAVFARQSLGADGPPAPASPGVDPGDEDPAVDALFLGDRG